MLVGIVWLLGNQAGDMMAFYFNFSETEKMLYSLS